MHTDPFIGRKVTFFFGPLALAIATLLSAKAKAWFGVDVNTAEAAAFILSIAAGIITWLYNLGKHEVAQVTGLSEGTVGSIAERAIDRNLPTTRPPVGEQPAPGGGQVSAGPPAGPGGTSSGQ